jgi:hypothetical protein
MVPELGQLAAATARSPLVTVVGRARLEGQPRIRAERDNLRLAASV